MKRKLPVVECNLCGSQQVDNGDPTEILGLTVKRAFFAGYGGGGPVPQDFFACISCLNGNDLHGPALLSVLTSLVFHDEEMRGPLEDTEVYAPKGKS